ncbi:MAG: hypothetical protein HW416_3449, partial [Chloroflexi bacterium]|nr:hypothetical protein [Chloroflexota bacterium]
MAEVQCLNHSGISVPDTRAGAEFYEKLFGAQVVNVIGGNSDEARRGRGVPHPMILVGDYALVVLVSRRELAPTDPGPDACRQAFAVPRARFADIVQRARDCSITFTGPVAHPDGGPIGESIYLEDPGRNRLEVCWRRDEGQPYQPSIALAAALPAPPAASTTQTLRADRFGGVVLEVGDLAATRAFYGPLFEQARGEWEQTDGALRFRAGEQTVEFVLRAEPRNRAQAAEHQAYRVGAGRVQSLADALASAGYTVNWWSEDHTDERTPTAYVQDPSGNRVQLVSADPDAGLLDHVGLAIHETEDAEAYYGNGLGGSLGYYYGLSTGNVLEARAAGVGDPNAAPWTRRATVSFRTHQPEPLPAAQYYWSFG